MDSRLPTPVFVSPAHYRRLAVAAALNTKKTGKKHPGKAVLAGEQEQPVITHGGHSLVPRHLEIYHVARE